MITLAIDFSTERRAVGVTDHAGRMALAMVADRRAGALSLVERALDEAAVSRDEIELIAVGLGPGSYTGIRSAIALAQGWQLVTGVKLSGVSSVEVMARSVSVAGAFEIIVDAQRGDVYRAGFVRVGGELRSSGALEIVSQEEVVGDVARFSSTPQKFSFPTELAYPDPGILAGLATGDAPVAGELLAPIYLREAEFRKAPPSREIR